MKRIGILLLVLAILIGGYLIIQSYPKGDTFTPPSEVNVSEWDQEALDQIVFTFPDEQVIELSKVTGQWFVNKYQADPNRIEDLFSAFAEAEISSRVSTNKQNHERFEVGEKGVDMQLLENGEVKQRLILGKSAGGESSYFRLPEQDAVYVLNGLPQYLVSSEEAIWRNREFISLAPDQIRAIRFEGSDTYKVEQTESGWFAETSSGATALLDEQKTLSWLARFKALQAIDFPSPEQELGRSLGTFIVEEGSLTSLTKGHIYELFPSEEENQLIIRNEEELLYSIQEAQLDQLLPDYTQLVDDLTETEETEE